VDALEGAEKVCFDLFEAGHGFSRAIQSLQSNAPLGAEASSSRFQAL
jgi:hypothetical protein